MNLLIVESPNKIQKIKAMLGPSVTVEQAAAMSEDDFKKTIKKFLDWKKKQK